MGYRSWLTPIDSREQWECLQKALQDNRLAYGISYVIHADADVPLIGGKVVVAWAGDTNCSLYEEMPEAVHNDTLSLDNVLDAFPAWHQGDGPTKCGKMLEADNVAQYLDERTAGSLAQQSRL